MTVEDHLSNAYYYVEQGNTLKAIEAYRDVLEIEPYNRRAYTGLGFVYRSHEWHEAARVMFVVATSLPSEENLKHDGYLFYVLAQESFLTGNDAEGIDALGSAIRLDRTLTETCRELVSAFQKTGRLDNVRNICNVNADRNEPTRP